MDAMELFYHKNEYLIHSTVYYFIKCRSFCFNSSTVASSYIFSYLMIFGGQYSFMLLLVSPKGILSTVQGAWKLNNCWEVYYTIVILINRPVNGRIIIIYYFVVSRLSALPFYFTEMFTRHKAL